ncbi:NAD-dependent epimerase/dehydratase family protein [Enterovibrio sp. Hal110]
MNILVLGGTGAMGVHLVKVLSDLGHDITITTRSDRKSCGNVKYIKGNAKDDSFLDKVLSSNWHAIIDFMVYTTNDFSYRVEKLLVSTNHYIFISSGRVYSGSDQPITEESTRLIDASEDMDFLKTDEYSLAKARQENLLSETEYKNWTVVRPYITYSEQRLQLGVLEKEEWLYRALNGRTIVFSKEILSKFTTMTYAYDVSEALANLVGREFAFGNFYNISNEKSISWEDVKNIYMNTLHNYIGVRPNIVLLGVNEFSKCKNAEYQIKYDRLFDRKFDSSKIKNEIKLNEFMDVEYGLSKCLQKFLSDPKFNAIDWRSEAVKDRYTGELTSFNEIDGIKNKIKYIIFRYLMSFRKARI